MSTASPGLSSLLPAGSALPAGERHQVPTGDGTRLHAIVAGAGTPLVLTHGALLSLEAWALLWQPLLAAGHQLIAYDLRGHGHSTLGRSGFGVQAYAQDLAAVLDHFDVRQGVVVAHSTGGIGALALAVSAPTSAHARLAGQVLISTPPQGIGDSLQNRLLAPLVFSGLIHQVVRRRRLGTRFTRTLFGSHPDPDLVEFARRLMAGAPRQTTSEHGREERMGTKQRPALSDILRGAADRIDAEDLPQTAEDVADFCDGARWATAQLRRIGVA